MGSAVGKLRSICRASWRERTVGASGCLAGAVFGFACAAGCAAGSADDGSQFGGAGGLATEGGAETSAYASTGSSDTIDDTGSDGPANPDDDAGSGNPDCGALDACGVQCVDLQSDPNNCGMCGVGCVAPNAIMACEAGACALDECEPGWSDCDGSLANGCEAEVSCSQGSSCETTCGTQGTIGCQDACNPVCQPPAEACNAVDDDCNGTCDERMIAGCRRGVHRAFSPQSGHLYTIDPAEASSGTFSLESLDFFWLYANPVEGLQPLYRCNKGNGMRLYTTSTQCESAGSVESILGYLAPDARCGAIPLYRLYNPGNGAHFYTINAVERDNAVAGGWTAEFIAGYVWPSG